MNKLLSRGRLSGLAGAFAIALLAASGPSSAAEGGAAIERQDWTFGGITGYFDNQQLRRGYLVYQNVCASCHGIEQLYYRNLSEPGGPEFSEERVRDIASQAQVTECCDDFGESFTRPGKPSDSFVSPYPNEKAAAASFGGVAPPDLSVITKARTASTAAPWYLEPFYMIYDLLTVYQEGGADYNHALLTGYEDPPEGVELSPGLYYNTVYPGNQIAMPAPLVEGIVEYPDGTPGTVENYSRDVTAFLMWAAEPTLEERKRMGLKVLLYLAILTVLLYLSKRALWRKVDH